MVDISDQTCNEGDGNQTSHVLFPDSRRNCWLYATHLLSFKRPLVDERVCSLQASVPFHSLRIQKCCSVTQQQERYHHIPVTTGDTLVPACCSALGSAFQPQEQRS